MATHRRQVRCRGAILWMAPLAFGLASAEAQELPIDSIGAGTAQRSWLPAGAFEVAPTERDAGLPEAVRVPDGVNRLTFDDVTRIWGVPVPRRGDPDYAPENPRYIGVVRDAPLTLPAIVIAPEGKLDPALPCVLITNGYGIAPGNSVVDRMLAPVVRRGYVGMEVALREASRDPLSQRIGRNDYLRFYSEDGVSIVNWMVNNFGCGATGDDPRTARVGMIGASLLGISQLQLLIDPDMPEALRAVVPAVADASYGILWYPGGMLPGPGRVARTNGEFARLFPVHRDFDSFWEARQVTRDKLIAPASRGVAMLMFGGWDDYITPGGIEVFEAYRSVTGGERKKLVVASAGHSIPIDLYLDQAMQWLDFWLKGVDNGADRDRVLIHVRGPERWRTESSWPLPDSRRVRLFLRGDNGSFAESPSSGSLGERAKKGDRAFKVKYDPQQGPFLRTMVSASASPPNSLRLTMNQSDDEKRVASWTSSSLASPIEVTGNPALSIWAASSTTDADFVVQLTDVHPDGSSRTVVAGYLNGPRMTYANRETAAVEPPTPLIPGQPKQFVIKLHPTSYVFRAGHRVRVSVAGGAAIGIGTDGKPQNAPQGPGRNPDAFEITLLQGANHASYLELPVVADGWAVLRGSERADH